MHWSHLRCHALYEHWAHLGSLGSYRTIVNLYCYGIIGTPASTCGGQTVAGGGGGDEAEGDDGG